jgi:hypothetical protein
MFCSPGRVPFCWDNNNNNNNTAEEDDDWNYNNSPQTPQSKKNNTASRMMFFSGSKNRHGTPDTVSTATSSPMDGSITSTGSSLMMGNKKTTTTNNSSNNDDEHEWVPLLSDDDPNDNENDDENESPVKSRALDFESLVREENKNGSTSANKIVSIFVVLVVALAISVPPYIQSQSSSAVNSNNNNNNNDSMKKPLFVSFVNKDKSFQEAMTTPITTLKVSNTEKPSSHLIFNKEYLQSKNDDTLLSSIKHEMSILEQHLQEQQQPSLKDDYDDPTTWLSMIPKIQYKPAKEATKVQFFPELTEATTIVKSQAQRLLQGSNKTIRRFAQRLDELKTKRRQQRIDHQLSQQKKITTKKQHQQLVKNQ